MSSKYDMIAFRCKKLTNVKTGIEVTRPDLKTGRSTFIEVAELRKNGIVLGMPPFSCAKGNELKMVIEINRSGNCSDFEAMAIVDETERLGSDGLKVVTTFKKYHSQQWHQVVEALEAEQKRLAEMFAAIKG